MTRFNPFPHLSGAYGAPMGRHGDSPEQFDPSARLYARPAGGDGYYDRGGAYWGRSPREGGVWAVWTRGGAQCAYVRAHSRAAAIALVDAARTIN